MTKHSTDPNKELLPSNGGTGPLRYTGTGVQPNIPMREAFNPRPLRRLATPEEVAARSGVFDADRNRERVAKRTWREWLSDRFGEWRYRRELAADDRDFAAIIRGLEKNPESPATFTEEQKADLAATIERLNGKPPTHLPNITAAEYERQFDMGRRSAARRASRLLRGLDPDTGIDLTTGYDELGRSPVQRGMSGVLLNLDGSWDRKALADSLTWRGTNRKTHPRYRYDERSWILLGSDYIHAETMTVLGPNGMTQCGRTEDEFIDEVLVPRYSAERAESDREAIELRFRMDAEQRSESFSYTLD